MELSSNPEEAGSIDQLSLQLVIKTFQQYSVEERLTSTMHSAWHVVGTQNGQTLYSLNRKVEWQPP